MGDADEQESYSVAVVIHNRKSERFIFIAVPYAEDYLLSQLTNKFRILYTGKVSREEYAKIKSEVKRANLEDMTEKQLEIELCAAA